MELKDILSVSGKSGLFRVIANTRHGLIAESLVDNRRIPVYASDKVSNLAEISIYTSDKEVELLEVFKSIYRKEKGNQAIDPKSEDKKLREYFAEILPNYDRERVYVSDIKKILSWYNLLNEKKIIDFSEEKPEEKKDTPEPESPAEEVENTARTEEKV